MELDLFQDGIDLPIIRDVEFGHRKSQTECDVQKVCRGQDSAQVGNQMDECSKFECGPDILAEKDREIEIEEAIELANNRIHVWLKQILVLCGLSARLGLITGLLL